MLTSAYDDAAPTFDCYRALPIRVPEAIRAAILNSISASSRPHLLDLGAGSGRIGWPFVVAGDDYVGVDLSSGMLREFARRAATRGSVLPRLAQADGQLLPFRDATFDTVMLVQVFGGLRGWRRLIAEARRVLRPAGVLVTGRTIVPADGLDPRMKQHLASILGELGIQPERVNARGDIERWLTSNAGNSESVIAAEWTASRTPRGFIERHGGGPRFSALAASVKAQALRDLGAWAAARFGSLDAVVVERHGFELQVFKFQSGMDR